MSKIHKRTMLVQEAHCEWSSFMIQLREKYNLTFGEILKFLGDEISSISKWTIRGERHPDDEDKGGDSE